MEAGIWGRGLLFGEDAESMRVDEREGGISSASGTHFIEGLPSCAEIIGCEKSDLFAIGMAVVDAVYQSAVE